ncbi:MAG TPA: hypothetical protein VKB05_01090 [Pyrinomonadaceae bacterium]|nr:hypothetical protein [Pyrinomonadaceae bacterium]
MATTKDQMVLEVWEKAAKNVVGASDLTLIQDALVERFGSESSPASIARVLADHGARLGHPEILQADSRWRERQHLFTPDDLAFDTIQSANAFIDKLEQLRQTHDQQSLRQSVQQIKQELDLLVTVPNLPATRRAVAREAAQWLTVWLQNPKIFAEWLDLRLSTAEFQELFGTFPPAQANTSDHGLTTAHETEKRRQR